VCHRARPDWNHAKPIHVISRSLSKQSRRATGAGAPTKTAGTLVPFFGVSFFAYVVDDRIVDYNILRPPPPVTTVTTPRSTPTFNQSSLPLDHPSRPPSPTSSSAIAIQNGHTRGIRSFRPKTAPSSSSTNGNGSNGSNGNNGNGAAFTIPNPITGVGIADEPSRKKKSVIEPDRTQRKQGKGMVPNATYRYTATTSGRSSSALGPLVGSSEPSPIATAVNGNATSSHVILTAAGVGARSPNRRLGAGIGISHGQFGASSVSFNILAPPPHEGLQPRPSSSMTFIPKSST
jgi:hypothetical protein